MENVCTNINDPLLPLKKLNRPLMLCDCIYQRPSKMTEWHDYINFVYKDLITGEKKLFTIKDPQYEIYLVKPEYRTFKKQRDFLEKSKLIEHVICYKDRFKEIAKLASDTSGDRKYMDIFRNARSESDKRMLYLYPYILGADIDIENYYISRWQHELANDNQKYVTKFFLDIEVNLKGWEGDIPKNGECPIDAVTLIDGVTKISHTFLYRTPDNPQVDEFLTPEKQKEFEEKAAELFEDFQGIKEYRRYMFDSELEMLKQLFVLIHSLKRDFGLVWNGCGFDLPYIKGRFEQLGVDPKIYMCHSDFPVPTLILFEDQKTFDFDKKRSFCTVSSYTHWIDQQIMYASLRKSQGALKKVSLDFIADKEEIGRKIDHTNIGNFTIFSYMDYMMYVLYNIKDVLLQWGIDEKVDDMFRYYSQCINNRCPLKDGLKQTVSLRCLFYDLLKYEYDMVLGHNINFMNAEKDNSDDDEDEDDSFEGAINADPMLNYPDGLKLFGLASKFLFGDSIDFDFSAMYPNAIMVFNIFKTTMIGKLIIEGVQHLLSYDQDAGKEFVEDMIAQDAVHTCHKWFDLPNTEDMTDLITEELKKSA